MLDLTAFTNKLEVEKRTCNAVVETPKGRRNKIDYDPESSLFCLSYLLPEGLAFPIDFGFIPSTLGEDGDPLDVMVLMDEPAHVGCLLDVRIIGAIEAAQTTDGKTNANDRLLAVALHSYAHENVASIEDVNDSLLEQLETFFVVYNRQRGRKFEVKGRVGPERALQLIQDGIATFKKKHRK